MKKNLCILVFLALAMSDQSLIAGSTNLPSGVPDSIPQLLNWPSAGLIHAKGVSLTNEMLQGALWSGERWVRLVIDPVWLPPQLEPVCTSQEFEVRDVVRYKWTKGGYAFVVAQTGSAFVMQITPKPGVLGATEIEKRKFEAREVCNQVFGKTGERWTGPQLNKVPVENLNSNIVSFSFGEGSSMVVTNAGELLIGKPRPNTDGRTTNGPLVSVDLSEDYWYKNIYWFADRKSVTIYFLKSEGGPKRRSFDGVSKWFNPDLLKRDRKTLVDPPKKDPH